MEEIKRQRYKASPESCWEKMIYSSLYLKPLTISKSRQLQINMERYLTKNRHQRKRGNAIKKKERNRIELVIQKFILKRVYSKIVRDFNMKMWLILKLIS